MTDGGDGGVEDNECLRAPGSALAFVTEAAGDLTLLAVPEFAATAAEVPDDAFALGGVTEGGDGGVEDSECLRCPGSASAFFTEAADAGDLSLLDRAISRGGFAACLSGLLTVLGCAAATVEDPDDGFAAFGGVADMGDGGVEDSECLRCPGSASAFFTEAADGDLSLLDRATSC